MVAAGDELGSQSNGHQLTAPERQVCSGIEPRASRSDQRLSWPFGPNHSLATAGAKDLLLNEATICFGHWIRDLPLLQTLHHAILLPIVTASMGRSRCLNVFVFAGAGAVSRHVAAGSVQAMTRSFAKQLKMLCTDWKTCEHSWKPTSGTLYRPSSQIESCRPPVGRPEDSALSHPTLHRRSS